MTPRDVDESVDHLASDSSSLHGVVNVATYESSVADNCNTDDKGHGVAKTRCIHRRRMRILLSQSRYTYSFLELVDAV